MLTAEEVSLIFAVALAHLAAFVALWYFGVARRFPWLAVHLLVEGIAQSVDCLFARTPYMDTVWAVLQIPRLIIRGLVVWEVWRESTVELVPAERRGLAGVCALACLLAGAGAVLILLLVPSPGGRALDAAAGLLIARQYLLLGYAAWLLLMNGYLLWTRTNMDHNLMLYRVFATLSAVVIFAASSFVAGGLGYRILPYLRDSWAAVHVWQCWYSLILIATLALFVRSERHG